MSGKGRDKNTLPDDIREMDLGAGCHTPLTQESQICSRKNVTSEQAITAMISKMSELVLEIRTLKCQADDRAVMMNGKLDSLTASTVCLSEKMDKMENLMVVHREALGEVKTAACKSETKKKPHFPW